MNNPGTFIPKQNSFNGHSVEIFTFDQEAVINKAPIRVTDFDGF